MVRWGQIWRSPRQLTSLALAPRKACYPVDSQNADRFTPSTGNLQRDVGSSGASMVSFASHRSRFARSVALGLSVPDVSGPVLCHRRPRRSDVGNPAPSAEQASQPSRSRSSAAPRKRFGSPSSWWMLVALWLVYANAKITNIILSTSNLIAESSPSVSARSARSA